LDRDRALGEHAVLIADLRRGDDHVAGRRDLILVRHRTSPFCPTGHPCRIRASGSVGVVPVGDDRAPAGRSCYRRARVSADPRAHPSRRGASAGRQRAYPVRTDGPSPVDSREATLMLGRLASFYATQIRVLWEWRGGRLALLRRLILILIVSTVSFMATA